MVSAAQPFQFVNKYASPSDLNEARLILAGGQDELAMDAAIVLGSTHWRADCECGCGKSYGIDLAIAVRVGWSPGESKLDLCIWTDACQLAYSLGMPASQHAY